MRTLLRYLCVVISLAAIPRPADAREVIHKGDTVVVRCAEKFPALACCLRRAVRPRKRGAERVFLKWTRTWTRDAAAKSPRLNHATVPTLFINANDGSAGRSSR